MSCKNLDPEVNLAYAVLRQAAKDMRRQGSPSKAQHTDAIIWLGSRKSTIYFDLVNLSQEFALELLDWTKFATKLLSDDDSNISAKQRKVLLKSLDSLSHSSPVLLIT